MNVLLQDATEKYHRAEFHRHELHAGAMEWLGSEAVLNTKPPVKQRFDPDPNSPETGTFVYKAVALDDVKPPTDLALILGDALTNYRATLDYIAWQLAVAPPRPDRVAFPIVSAREQWHLRLERQVPGITATYASILLRYQPFQWPLGSRASHPLGVLARLVNHDKHRTLRVIAATSLKVTTDLADARAKNFEITDAKRYYPGPEGVVLGDDIVRLHGRILTPGEPFSVEMLWTGHQVTISIQDEALAVAYAVDTVSAMVGQILDEFQRII